MYLVLKGSIWQAKQELSPKVAKVIGKRRFTVSLKTTDPKVAKQRAAVYEALWRAQIANAQDQEGQDHDAEFWRILIASLSPQERKLHLDSIETQLDLKLYDVNKKHRIVDLSEPEIETFPEVKHLKKTYQVAAGNLTPLQPLIEPYRAAMSHLEPKTLDMSVSAAKKLSERFKYLEDVVAQEWVDILLEEGKAPKTIKKILSFTKGFLKYVKKGSEEIFQKVEMPRVSKKSVGKTSIRPFTPEQLTEIYKVVRKDPKKQQLADLIELGRWTGARIEELCSLKVEDVVLGKKGASDHFKIVDSKTHAGIRSVPIHPKLKPTLDRLLRESEDGYVLSGLTFNKYGDRSNAIGKSFGRLKSDLGYLRSHVFHSIRKTVVTQLENAGVLENIAADIVGHDKPNITFGLYGGGASLEVKAEALRKLKYPD